MHVRGKRGVWFILAGLLALIAAAPFLGACGRPPENERVSEIDGKVMVRIPAGEFLMGTRPEDRDSALEERPQHTVMLDEFWIDKTETTNAQYQQCVEAGACRPPERAISYTRPSYYGDEEFADYPVIWVNWHDAQAYCQWAGKRLPTEAEWEKAARGPEPRRYPWGEEWPDGRRVNMCDINCEFDDRQIDIDDGFADTSPVGHYPEGANPFGLLDMAGNVWEWVHDWYADDYYEWTTKENPQGPQYGEERVMRGGAWNMWQIDLRTAAREKGFPHLTYPNVGFRCAGD